MTGEDRPPRYTSAIQQSDVRAGFSCRQSELARFFADNALEVERHGFGRTFVLRNDPPSSVPSILGFYTICMGQLHVTDLPPEVARALPFRRMPVGLLGQLARELRSEKGLGEWLLQDALRRFVAVSGEVGCAAVMLDAKNKKLVDYYEGYGFQPTARSGSPQKMFIQIETVKQLLA